MEERQKVAALFQFPSREAGGTDSRQRAPRQVGVEMLGERVVEREFRIAAGKALVDKLALRPPLVGIGDLLFAEGEHARKRAAVEVLRKRNIERLRPREEADNFPELLFEEGGGRRQHLITPLYLRSKESIVLSPWPG